jgi:hypothetical protein
MIAAQNSEMATRIGIAPLFDVFDPRAVHANGDVVLFFAGDSAGMAADAAVLIDDESVAH